MTGHVDEFVSPNRTPLTDQEWRWIEVMRSIVGGHLPPLTLQQTQNMHMLLTTQKG